MKVQVLQDILSANDAIAAQNREVLDKNKIIAFNIMSSPGAGKTSLILQTIATLKNKVKMAVIEGDVASKLDADKIQKEQIPVVQINIGSSCSLEANMLIQAINSLPLRDIELLFIENVGNLICPAEFALGEHEKIVISSIPEGSDKPLKYTLMFTEANVILINKLDLLPYLDFNLDSFRKTLKGLNPKAEIFEISCTTGEGIDNWCSWILNKAKELQQQ